MAITRDFIYAPKGTVVQDVLVAYVMRHAEWWWVLVARTGGEHRICSFGSLLPYLTGRTPHIVHDVGACAICGGLDPILWRDTRALIVEALSDPHVCHRSVADLPMALLPVVDSRRAGEADFIPWLLKQHTSVYGVTEEGVFAGVSIDRMRSMDDLSSVPSF